MKRKLVTLLLAGVLSVSAMACGASSSETKDQTTESTTEDTAAEDTAAEDTAEDGDTALMDKYTQLKNGMSYDEVKETMGSDGEDITADDAAENTKVYQWTSEGSDSTISVTFEDDKAVSFSQEGFE